MAKDNKDHQYTYKELITQSKGFERTILKQMLLPSQKYTMAQAGAVIKKFLETEAK